MQTPELCRPYRSITQIEVAGAYQDQSGQTSCLDTDAEITQTNQSIKPNPVQCWNLSTINSQVSCNDADAGYFVSGCLTSQTICSRNILCNIWSLGLY